jgi:hypothetical protein
VITPSNALNLSIQLPDYPIIQLPDDRMRLWVEPMESYVVEVTEDGLVRLENEEPAMPTLQERRAILYAAEGEIEALKELIEILEKT